ncbi:heterocyst frequency control protein PatD [Synechococcus sp. PCC 7336]|uniref:heterocyst frequency control protein PatD n=1 Tax=Synechococcus sp. PCC 7336 TaxID=195250 RepID=UPI00037B179D|nr:heterocyst frequency control protein PatD [Synechococcus sp. PCC 7336]
MLPESSLRDYRTLLAAVGAIAQAIAAGDADEAKAQYQPLPSQFQILLAAMPPPLQQSLQRYNTEIYKEIQLLEADLMRWQIAKQAATQQARSQQIQQRCDRIASYIRAILES